MVRHFGDRERSTIFGNTSDEFAEALHATKDTAGRMQVSWVAFGPAVFFRSAGEGRAVLAWPPAGFGGPDDEVSASHEASGAGSTNRLVRAVQQQCMGMELAIST